MKHGNKDWGQACDSSAECKEGLQCGDGTCEAAPSCETNADCDSGVCSDNKCSASEGGGATGKYKKNWLGIHFAQDIAIIGGSDVCSAYSRANNGYACYVQGSTDQPYNGDPFPGAGISSGTVIATRRLLLSFDRAFSPNITLGVRVGFAFGGGPPAGKGPDDQGRPRDPNDPNRAPLPPTDGTSFLPFHAELRLAYWFGKGALGKKGLHPYVHLGGGVAQVDGKVKVTLADCPYDLPDADYYACTAGDKSVANAARNVTRTYQVDAWRKMGQGFITAGGGAMYAFTTNLGAQLNVNLMYMLPSSGIVIQPSLGLLYGF